MNPITGARHTLPLSGLDGSNPLAFLAALGTLRTLARTWPAQHVLMSWSLERGTWSPALHLDRATDPTSLVCNLGKTLETDARRHPIAFMESMHGTGPEEVRKLFHDRARAARMADRDGLDWLSAMCSDLATEATSQLQTARRDYFWGNVTNVMKQTTAEHLCRTLFQPWDYADPLDNQSLHIEPSEDRRHALQWRQPSGDPERKRRGGMLGANRLAIEAFPFFQSIATGDKLSTQGFSGTHKDDTRWTWPLWSFPVGVEILRSLLALPELQADTLDVRSLSTRGVVAVFRCWRILIGNTPNFTPAMAVL